MAGETLWKHHYDWTKTLENWDRSGILEPSMSENHRKTGIACAGYSFLNTTLITWPISRRNWPNGYPQTLRIGGMEYGGFRQEGIPDGRWFWKIDLICTVQLPRKPKSHTYIYIQNIYIYYHIYIYSHIYIYIYIGIVYIEYTWLFSWITSESAVILTCFCLWLFLLRSVLCHGGTPSHHGIQYYSLLVHDLDDRDSLILGPPPPTYNHLIFDITTSFFFIHICTHTIYIYIYTYSHRFPRGSTYWRRSGSLFRPWSWGRWSFSSSDGNSSPGRHAPPDAWCCENLAALAVVTGFFTMKIFENMGMQW